MSQPTGRGASIGEAIFGGGEEFTLPARAAVGSLLTPEPEPPRLRPVQPEFRRRRRRQQNIFDLFGTLLTGPQTGALTQPPATQPKTILGE